MISDNELVILEGDCLTKNELKSRLHQMEIDFNTNAAKKAYYVDIYDKAVKFAKNRQKILDRLKKDTEENADEGRRKRTRETSEDAARDLKIEGRLGKIEKKKDVEIRKGVTTAKINLGIFKDKEKLSLNTDNNLKTLAPGEHIHCLHPEHPHKVHSPVMFTNVISDHDKNNIPIIKPLLFGNQVQHMMDNLNAESHYKSTVYSGNAEKYPNYADNYPTYTGNFPSGTFSNPLTPLSINNNEQKLNRNIKDFNTGARNVYYNLTKFNTDASSTHSGKKSFELKNNEVFKEELEAMKKVSSQPGSQKTMTYVNRGERVPKITVSSLKRIPGVKAEVGIQQPIEKWVLAPNQPAPLKTLIKYFVAGVAASVLFYGLYYCIKNCADFTWENLGIRRIEKEEEYMDFTKDTTTSRTFDVLNSQKISDRPMSPPYTIGKEETFSFTNWLKDFFSPLTTIYRILTNPKEFLWNIFIDSLRYVTIDLAWNFIKNNIWYFLGLLVLKVIAYKAYIAYLNNKNAKTIFKNIKERLRIIYDANSHYEGITEDEIIREYSKDYEMKDMYFKNNIMPKLKKMRREDGDIREFETYTHGRLRVAWQYVGYC